MSKEVAAAILTNVYFQHVRKSKNVSVFLRAPKKGMTSNAAITLISTVYEGFLKSATFKRASQDDVTPGGRASGKGVDSTDDAPF